MPSKKPTKAVKKPVKASPKKAAAKPVAAKKPARPQAGSKPAPGAAKTAVGKAPKAAAKSPVPKAAAAKPTKPRPAAAPEKVVGSSLAAEAPESFGTRPLVAPVRAIQSDEDMDAESTVASLLAGPRNVQPYIARRGEQYMSKEQLEHFARILTSWKRDLMEEVDRTVLHMKDEAANFPDPNDRATQEEEFSLELRTRDRERKLIRKIDEALKRIEDGTYGYCLETGEEIGIKRLEARPVATLSVEAQERRERREKQYGDRDDRYR